MYSSHLVSKSDRTSLKFISCFKIAESGFVLGVEGATRNMHSQGGRYTTVMQNDDNLSVGALKPCFLGGHMTSAELGGESTGA